MTNPNAGFTYQDWNTITFNKHVSKITKQKVLKKNVPNTAMNKLDNATEVQKQRFIDKGVAKLILTGRLENKLSQKDLATKVNVTVQVIASFENGKAVSNPSNDKILNNIKRVLKISNKKKC